MELWTRGISLSCHQHFCADTLLHVFSVSLSPLLSIVLGIPNNYTNTESSKHIDTDRTIPIVFPINTEDASLVRS